MCNTHYNNVCDIVIDVESGKLYMYHDGTGRMWELKSDFDVPVPDWSKLKQIARFNQDEMMAKK